MCPRWKCAQNVPYLYSKHYVHNQVHLHNYNNTKLNITGKAHLSAWSFQSHYDHQLPFQETPKYFSTAFMGPGLFKLIPAQHPVASTFSLLFSKMCITIWAMLSLNLLSGSMGTHVHSAYSVHLSWCVFAAVCQVCVFVCSGGSGVVQRLCVCVCGGGGGGHVCVFVSALFFAVV